MKFSPSYLNFCFFMHSENWVLHSTAEYAENVIAQTGLQKLPAATLDKVAEELFQEFQNTGLSIPRPFYKKAHRWLVSEFQFSCSPSSECTGQIIFVNLLLYIHVCMFNLDCFQIFIL